MASLYELSAEYSDLQAMLESGCESPEDEQAIIDAMNAVSENIFEKADGYAKIMRNMASEAEAIKAEEKRLYARRKTLENGVERLKAAMYNAMILTGAKKLSTSIGSWNIQKNPQSVNVLDVSKVPARFLIEQPPTVDKRAMLEEFKLTGEIFDGVEITRGESVRFR